MVSKTPFCFFLFAVDAVVREISIVGAFRYCHDYKTALSLVASGTIDIKPLITDHFQFDQSLEAFELAKKNTAIKIQIHL
jgi:L-iditol 2-dehydrogenase